MVYSTVSADASVPQAVINEKQNLGTLLASLKRKKENQGNEAVVISIVSEVGPDFDMNRSRALNDLADVKQKDF